MGRAECSEVVCTLRLAASSWRSAASMVQPGHGGTAASHVIIPHPYSTMIL